MCSLPLSLPHLPVELKLMIFDHLDLKELMKCRLVSKRWKSCVDQFRVKELAIVNTESDWFHYILYNKFYSYESLNHQNLFEPSDLVLFKQALTNKLFRNLEYLNISYYINWREFNIETLNQFDRLVQLDIHSIEVSNRSRLNLPNLRILCIFEVVKAGIVEDEFIEFNSHKLQVIRCNENLNVLIKLLNPQSIKNLQVNLCCPDLSSFTNLEIYQQNFASNLNEDILSILPDKLKELHLYNLVRGPAFEQMKNLLLFLMRQRIELKRFDLNIYFMGIRLIDGKSLSDYDFGFNYYKSHLKNYHLLSDRLPFFNQIDYDVLINSKHEIPTDFFRRFNNIQIISAVKVKNQEKFIDFLSNCPHLIELDIKNSSLNSDFYAQLPKLCSLLKLKIEKQSHPVDYEFIYKFKKLIEFQTNQSIPIAKILESFRRCKYLRNFEIITSSEKVYFRKHLKNSYSFKCLYSDSNNNYGINCVNYLKNECIDLRNLDENATIVDEQNISYDHLVKLSTRLLK